MTLLFRKYLSKVSQNNLLSITIQDVEKYLRQSHIINTQQTWMDFLIKGKMADIHETPGTFWQRISSSIAMAGLPFYGKQKAYYYQDAFQEVLQTFKLIPSTPIYTNAGRHLDKSFSACAVPPVNFKSMNKDELGRLIRSYHTKGMGTGFNFDETEHPLEMLKLLNQFAVNEVRDGVIERPVGNMGIISIDHPKVLDFIRAKFDKNISDWKFNISVNINDAFMHAFKNKKLYQSSFGHCINPEELMEEIARCVLLTGDPGVVFMHRYEQSNKTPFLGKYVSLAPCGEVPLLNGEVCQFGYLNLYAFLNKNGIDYQELKRVIHLTVLFLDNALHYTMGKVNQTQSENVISQVRKIGVGICGFADLLMHLGIAYDSLQGLQLASDLISFINYESKLASVELAKQRGAFPAFYDQRTNKEQIIKPFINQSTSTVSSADWLNLSRKINEYGIRHSATTILPPTGRSAMVGGASTSIEPHFRLNVDNKLQQSIIKHCQRYLSSPEILKLVLQIQSSGKLGDPRLPDSIKQIFACALELSPKAHLNMVHHFQKFTDEAISKTVNLPKDSQLSDITNIYQMSYDMGLKGMSVYVDGSRQYQPKAMV